MVKTPAEVFANLSDAQTALKIALPVGSESAIWKRGERGEAKSKSTPFMIWKGAGEDTRYSCGHGRPLAPKGAANFRMNLHSVSVDGLEYVLENVACRMTASS